MNNEKRHGNRSRARSKAETTIVSIDVFADVQQEPDGSWVAHIFNRSSATRSGSTRDEALRNASEAASVRIA